MQTQAELELVAQIKRGQRAAFTPLWEATTPKLYGYLLNTLRNAPAAEDILQQTWIKAIEGLPNFRSQGIKFSAWLFAIARNECRQAWRTQERHPTQPLPEDDLSPATSHHTQRVEQKILIEEIFRELSADDQEILRLRYLGEFEFREIAAILNISTISARVRVHRALSRAQSIIKTP